MRIDPKPQSVKKFYFLEYFYILLQSIRYTSKKEKVFDYFIKLKKEYNLGESKYKRLTIDTENLSPLKETRYYYTFEEVISEANDYKLIATKNDELHLKLLGEETLNIYEKKGALEFKKAIFVLMERKYFAFYYLINFCNVSNPNRGGLLIFPNYSPLKLKFERKSIKTTKDIVQYSVALTNRLESDIQEYLGKKIDLQEQHLKIILRLKKVGIIPFNENEKFENKKYNSILKRFRDFWYDFFLRNIYNYTYSLNTFDIWIYRAKQVGIVNATEFFPNFNGRIVYPTSVIVDDTPNPDFEKIFEYNKNLSLYLHSPSWEKEEIQENFVASLTNIYFTMKQTSRSYFVNLADIRELVCYNLKISDYLFNDFLQKAYKLNLAGKLRINISLESDRLPQETQAIYLKREPILINDSYKNIIAIDLTKGAKKHGKHRLTVKETV